MPAVDFSMSRSTTICRPPSWWHARRGGNDGDTLRPSPHGLRPPAELLDIPRMNLALIPVVATHCLAVLRQETEHDR
jgi:hypothetical protein